MDIEKCRQCGRPFQVNEIGGKLPGTRESEDIECPHCGDVTTRRSNAFFRTSKLSSEAEKRWLEEQGGTP